jgi:hypothetical protein
MTLRRRTHTLSVLSALLLGCGAQVFAGDSPQERETLKGIKGLVVAVEALPAEAAGSGLTDDQLQTDVELRLRRAGINIMGPGSIVILDIDVRILKVQNTSNTDVGYVYFIDVSLYQGAVVMSNSAAAIVRTWSISSLNTIGRLGLEKEVRESLGDLVDKFLNAYLSVNPK